MEILVQDSVPIGSVAFESEAKAVKVTREQLLDREYPQASHLLVRADFRVDESLLNALPGLQRVGLVSTGFDNIDIEALKKRGIVLDTAAGVNARAVRDYVAQALLEYWHFFNRKPSQTTVGILGVGNVGEKVYTLLRALNVPTRVYDPFRFPESSPDRLREAEIVTVHVPLTDPRQSEYPTKGFLSKKSPFWSVDNLPYVIQTSRGGCWNEDAYEFFLGQEKIWAQDVYPVEPPLPKWLKGSHFCTPHIAGYSLRGRLGGIRKILCEDWKVAQARPLPPARFRTLIEDDLYFREKPKAFRQLRNEYPLRKELWELSTREREWFTRRYSNMNMEAVFEK